MLAICASMSRAANAQSASTEIWPEIDILWTPARHQRTFLELSASNEREGSKREATFGLYQDYLMLPRGYVRAGYRYTFSTRDASYRESRAVLEATLAIRAPFAMRVVNRVRPEFRWVNGAYSYRVRDRVHVGRLPSILQSRGRFWAPYVTFEAYYDSRFDAIARIGGRVGTEFSIRGPAAMDVYLARQNNSQPERSYVNALGTVLKLNYR
ncbi:MAG TPA: hypothetical protein VKH19_02310 [Gemmatimonadaceae bacterium]|nr:hypothetical protein [Gemmatimonadaceae bacterium]